MAPHHSTRKLTMCQLTPNLPSCRTMIGYGRIDCGGRSRWVVGLAAFVPL
ncbi:unnamed protein product [Haemonchus placei]|uniref:Peptidase S1 domain-containing protein n=1 Tax=Haemonchus placei TaxID=6290 RepID=A0A0N4VT52_HAEPC|nr:unnamed protein product [Haemonchus placei]